MAYTVTRLRPRYNEIIRCAFLGWSATKIAAHIGISPAAVACVLRSPLAQAEMARMEAEARALVIDTPLRVRRANELECAADEALQINHALMKESTVDARVRAGIARHFLDRVMFDRTEDTKEGTYREILRRLDDVQKQLGTGVYLLPPESAVVVKDNGGNGTPTT